MACRILSLWLTQLVARPLPQDNSFYRNCLKTLRSEGVTSEALTVADTPLDASISALPADLRVVSFHFDEAEGHMYFVALNVPSDAKPDPAEEAAAAAAAAAALAANKGKPPAKGAEMEAAPVPKMVVVDRAPVDKVALEALRNDVAEYRRTLQVRPRRAAAPPLLVAVRRLKNSRHHTCGWLLPKRLHGCMHGDACVTPSIPCAHQALSDVANDQPS